MRVQSLLKIRALKRKWFCLRDAQCWRALSDQTIKSKPAISGFKFFNRCFSRGYTYKFEIYHGARLGEKKGISRNNEVVERVVVDLCQTLAERGHVVFDRFFKGHCPTGQIPRELCQRRCIDSSKSCLQAHHDEERVQPSTGWIWSQVRWLGRNMPKGNLRMEGHWGVLNQSQLSWFRYCQDIEETAWWFV